MADEQINIEVNLKDDASANATVIAERIDNIGDQAAQAARKLATLKAALKAVDGTSADATVKVKESRSEFDRMGDAAMRADNKIKKSIGGKNGGLFGMINFGFKFKALFSFFKWGAIADGVTLIGSAVAALGGAAVSAIGAFTPILGVAGAAPGVLGAMAQSMLVLKAGFKGVSEIATPLFEKINEDIEKVIGPSLQRLTKGLLAANGALRNGLVATAKQLKPSIKELDQYLNKGAGKGQLSSFMGNNAEIAGKLGTLATPALKGLFAVIEAATPMTNMLVDKFVSFGNTLSNLAQNNGPAMMKFFDNAGRIFNNTTKTLGDFTKGLYEIGKLSVGLGGEMGMGLMDMMAKFRAWTESAAGQNRIKQFFDDIRPPLDAAWKLLVAVAQAFGRISVSGKGMDAMTKTFDSLRTSVVPVLEKMLEAAQGNFIPQMAEALANIANIMMNLKMAEIFGGLTKAVSIISSVLAALPAPVQTVLGIMVTIAALVKIIGIGFGFWAKGIGSAIKAMATYIGQLLAAKALEMSPGRSAAKGVDKFLPTAAPASRAAPGAGGGAVMSAVMSGLKILGGGTASAGAGLLAIAAAAGAVTAGFGYLTQQYLDAATVFVNPEADKNVVRDTQSAHKIGAGTGGYAKQDQMQMQKWATEDSDKSNIAAKTKEYYDLGDSIEVAQRKAESYVNTVQQARKVSIGGSLGQQVQFVKAFGNALGVTDKRWAGMVNTAKGQKKVGDQFKGLASYAKMSGTSVSTLATKFPGLTAALARNGKTIDQTTGKIVKMDAKAKAKRNPMKYQATLLDKATSKMNKIDSTIKRLTRKRNQLILKGKDETSPEIKKIDRKIQGKKNAKVNIGAKIEKALAEIEKIATAAKQPETKPVNIGGDWASQIAEINRLASEPVTKPLKIDEQRFAGGPVWAGLTSWVGELGPEMLVRPGMAPEMVGMQGPTKMDFHSDGVIIPNHMLPEEATAGSVRSAPMQLSPSIHTGSGGAGNAINIANVNMTQEMDLTRELVRAQRAMERDKRERAIRPINGRRG